MSNKDNIIVRIKYLTGLRLILKMIKKNVKKPLKNKKYKVWRPSRIEYI